MEMDKNFVSDIAKYAMDRANKAAIIYFNTNNCNLKNAAFNEIMSATTAFLLYDKMESK